MNRRLLQITVLVTAFFGIALYGLADVAPASEHECTNEELAPFSCERPGFCTNACAVYCKSQIACIRCCDKMRTNQGAAECLRFCGMGMVAPADYLAD